MLNDCWLFLDCRIMTGKSFKKCPNRKACKQDALNNPNRQCELPYRLFDPEMGNQLFDTKTLIVENYIEEAFLMGWQPAESIDKYTPYLDGCLWVGGREVFYNCFDFSSLELPKELQALGWAVSEKIPYAFYDFWIDSNNNYHYYLKVVTADQKHQEFGWHSSVSLPYFKYFEDTENNGRFGSMWISFSVEDPRYTDAVKLGWYPPQDYREKVKVHKYEL